MATKKKTSAKSAVKVSDESSVQCMFHLNKGHLDWVKYAASQAGVSESKFIRDAVKTALRKAGHAIQDFPELKQGRPKGYSPKTGKVVKESK